LIIRDNGSGLTKDEVIEYLSTIGRSYTRELGEKLSILSPDEAARLIGQFGLGFLSAFLIGSQATLVTRSMRGDSAIAWRSSGDVNYELSPAERDEIGTTVELQLKPGASFLLNPEILIDVIQQYADFLPIPIYVAGQRHPINLTTPPWEERDSQSAIRAYIARAYKVEEPLCVIELHDQETDLGYDKLTLPLKGFLFVPPHSVASVSEYGDLWVYIRRMFICANQRDLLPSWARFVRGAIDCPYLQPTASREEIHQDDTFNALRQALEQQLTAGLRRIAREEPLTWKKIVYGHADLITGWAGRDSNFFNEVADIVPLRTSRGLLRVPEYREITGDTLYFVTRQFGSLQEQVIGEGHGVPVIEAGWFGVRGFLEKYAEFRAGIKLVQLDGDAERLLRPAAETSFSPLLDYYRKRGIQIQMASFRPVEIPALMIYPKDTEFLLDARRALDDGSLPDPIAGLIGAALDRRGRPESFQGTLYLNASCPLIEQLAESEIKAIDRDSALALIYQVARLFAGRTLTAADVSSAFSEVNQAVEALVKS